MSSRSVVLTAKQIKTILPHAYPFLFVDAIIHINLEETKSESMDYKKMALPKLRSVVTEKGLISDASKLKKNELLNLLGVK